MTRFLRRLWRVPATCRSRRRQVTCWPWGSPAAHHAQVPGYPSRGPKSGNVKSLTYSLWHRNNTSKDPREIMMPTTAAEHLTTFLALPSWSILQRPAHSPSFMFESTLISGIPCSCATEQQFTFGPFEKETKRCFTWQRAVTSFLYIGSSQLSARMQRRACLGIENSEGIGNSEGTAYWWNGNTFCPGLWPPP